MENKSIGETIAALRKEKGMTQKELADKLHITDKAVSKWERNIACPDTATIPRLADILGVSIEELMGKFVSASRHRGALQIFNIAFRAIPLAMGIAVAVTALLGELDVTAGFTMLGFGLACVGLSALKE